MRFKAFIVVISGALCLALLFVFLKPGGSEVSDVAELQVQALGDVEQSSESAKETEAVFIEITEGKRVAGPEIVRVEQGKEVNLVFRSDKDAELHLHGYEHKLLLKAAVPLAHRFVAEHSGRFEYELHGQHAHQALGVIEVMPR